MSSVQFRFSTDVLRRLGEELTPSADQSILELVKNAYDADATECRIELIDTDAPGGTIRITDDGYGMTPSDIVDGWLVLGRSRKATGEPTRSGRIPSGSKGLGRLAALRLGRTALLVTRPKERPGREYQLAIDWARFDEADLVDNVPLEIADVPRLSVAASGTSVTVDHIRERVGRMDVKRLARAILLLADPFDDDPRGFRPVLEAAEFKDLEALVSKRYFDDSEYKLEATVDSGGHARATVTDWKGKSLFRAAHKELAVGRGGRPYDTPPATFSLWVFLLNAETFSTRRSTLSEVREWLQAFGGVHLYHNKLRVSPYGNPGTDWLELSLRRAQSPEERPSTNTVIGRVRVDDPSERLVQKTDRIGFVETESFADLRAFAIDALEWMARRRLEAAERRRQRARQVAPKKSEKARSGVEKAISQAPKGVQAGIRTAFAKFEKSKHREVLELRKEVQLYRTLSTAGITAATFAHEAHGNPLKAIVHSVGALERRVHQFADDADYARLFNPPIEEIKVAADALGVLGRATLSLLAHEKRRASVVPLHRVINGIVDLFEPFLLGRKVEVELCLADAKPEVRGSEAALESIVTNLINNSLTAFEQGGVGARKIRIATAIEGDVVSVTVCDSGPGIQGINVRDIWLPGATTRPAGTGLGLTIVRDAVQDLGGTVEARKSSVLGGAEVQFVIPIIGG